jgi:glycosyltransferase involved in cell wall biosynthesis
MQILLLEPYFTGSHQVWAEGYARHSQHQISILSLPGRWWKWRMHGGAVTLARMAQAWVSENNSPDMLLATDMLDLTTFLALSRSWSTRIPVALYMHENQLTYPLPGDPDAGPMRRQRGERDLHYAFINYTSMLAADAVLFNSRYHRESWFDELPNLLKHFPDLNELESVPPLRAKSSVLPLGMELLRLKEFAPRSAGHRDTTQPPLIVWNHRWEYDKDPETFFRALYVLADRGLDFRVAVCGENFRRVPAEFERAQERLGDRILQWGRVEAWTDYVRLLWDAEVVVSTALHDFFGAAVVEAIYCACRPVLPQGLSYPEHIPKERWPDCLYTDFDELLERLEEAIRDPALNLQMAVARYDWGMMAKKYDALLAAVS